MESEQQNQAGQPALVCAKVRMLRLKPTKNTVKFGEVAQPGQPPIVGVLYVQKWWAGEVERIDVELRKVDNGDD